MIPPETTGISFNDAQMGDVGMGDVAGANLTKNTINGVDPARIMQTLDLLVKVAWDDGQARTTRQAEVDAERRHERDEDGLRWEMICQSIEAIRGRLDRLDAVVQRLDHLDDAIAETHAEARRVRAAGLVVAAVLAVLIIVTIVLALDRYYLGGRLLLAIVGASGALSLYAVTRSR